MSPTDMDQRRRARAVLSSSFLKPILAVFALFWLMIGIIGRSIPMTFTIGAARRGCLRIMTAPISITSMAPCPARMWMSCCWAARRLRPSKAAILSRPSRRQSARLISAPVARGPWIVGLSWIWWSKIPLPITSSSGWTGFTCCPRIFRGPLSRPICLMRPLQ